MQNDWVLITGASSGIGLELARVFAKNKFNLVLLARGEARLRNLATELEKVHSIQTRVIARDLGRPFIAKEIFSDLQRDGIFISILVNNAGFGAGEFFAREKIETCTEMVQTNITALMELTYFFLQPMLEKKKGRILQVASTAAFQPGPKMSVYYASKAFVFSFSYALANEVAGAGVTVTTLCPGPTRTEFHLRASSKRSPTVGKLMMTAEDVARIAYEGTMKGKRVVIPGAVNKLGVALSKMLPTRFSTAAVRKVLDNE